MSAPAPTTPTPRQVDPLRPVRYIVRVPLLLALVPVTLPIALLAGTRFALRRQVGGEALHERLVRVWCRGLVRLFGFRIRVFGEPLPGPVLFVANHISWLDIVLLDSARPVSFVAKAEIGHWPLIGWLAARSRTIFHRRGNTDSLQAVMTRVVERLREGEPVGVFPEGGSGRGGRVGTFHARIFQTALDAAVPVQPVALRYGRNGRQDPRVPFAAGEKFLPNFLRILGGPRLDAELHFLPPVTPTPDARRQMAEEARARIVATLGYGDA